MKIFCTVNVCEKLIMAEIIFESSIFSKNRICKSASCPYLELKGDLLKKARRKRKDGCFTDLHGNC